MLSVGLPLLVWQQAVAPHNDALALREGLVQRECRLRNQDVIACEQ